MRQSLILQPFRRFTYVTADSTTLPLFRLRHRHFTYVTWRAAHGTNGVVIHDADHDDDIETEILYTPYF